MANATLKLEARERDMTIPAKQLLTQKLLPAVFYGNGKENEVMILDYEEFRKVFRDAGSNTIVTLKLPSGKSEKVLIHEVQLDPVKDTYRHVDFYGLQMKEKITTTIPLHLVGESNAVKNFGGVLISNLDELEVRCLPTDLVHHIEVSLETLENIGDSIHVSEIAIPKGIEVLADMEETVASVQPPVDSSTESDEVPAMDVNQVAVATEKKESSEE